MQPFPCISQLFRAALFTLFVHLLDSVAGRRIQGEINVFISLLQAGAAEKGRGGARGLSPLIQYQTVLASSNTLIECSVSKILSKIRPILSLFFHDNVK